jgi:hypothetical protein
MWNYQSWPILRRFSRVYLEGLRDTTTKLPLELIGTGLYCPSEAAAGSSIIHKICPGLEVDHHLRLVPRLRMHGVILPLLHTSYGVMLN